MGYGRQLGMDGRLSKIKLAFMLAHGVRWSFGWITGEGFAFEGFLPEPLFYSLYKRCLGGLMFGMVVVGVLGLLDN